LWCKPPRKAAKNGLFCIFAFFFQVHHHTDPGKFYEETLLWGLPTVEMRGKKGDKFQLAKLMPHFQQIQESQVSE
jgi:hypothetical protein